MGYYVNAFDVDMYLKDVPTELLNELVQNGFHFDAFEDNDRVAVYAIDGKWSWIEDDLLKLAPYVVEPGHVYFSGEDYEQFRVVFDDNTMSIYDSQVIYNKEPTVQTRY